MTALQTTPIIARLDDIAADYDALYCDLWGCLHNGLAAYPAAVAALRAFRAQGKSVILITNAPRAAEPVARDLATMGAPEDCWDAIVSSGDAARAAVRAGDFGRRVVYVGPPRDLDFFDGLGAALVGADEADSVICVGFVDDSSETPETYAPAIRAWRARRLPMLCANPDVIVDRGHERLYCAGAIAEAYRAAGGAVTYSGKPHAPIYALGAEVLTRLRGPGPGGAGHRHAVCDRRHRRRRDLRRPRDARPFAAGGVSGGAGRRRADLRHRTAALSRRRRAC